LSKYISIEFTKKGKSTENINSYPDMIKLYGVECYNKYRLARYRKLGDISYISQLSKRFYVNKDLVTDPITSDDVGLFLCKRKQ